MTMNADIESTSDESTLKVIVDFADAAGTRAELYYDTVDLRQRLLDIGMTEAEFIPQPVECVDTRGDENFELGKLLVTVLPSQLLKFLKFLIPRQSQSGKPTRIKVVNGKRLVELELASSFDAKEITALVKQIEGRVFEP